MDYFKAIAELKPGSVFSIEGNDYSTLWWGDDNESEPPTENEVHQKAEELSELQQRNAYQFNRMMAYPDFGTQMDIIYHQGLDAWREEINKVKEKYPKPEGS